MLQKVQEGYWTIAEKDRVPMKQDYFDEYQGKADTEIGKQLNLFRANLAKAYRNGGPVLDIGIGDGAFINAVGKPVYGYDIDPKAADMLADNNMFLSPYVDDGLLKDVSVVTFFDSLEHIPEFRPLLRRLAHVPYIIVSVPIFKNAEHARGSKHYKPDEHLHYFTEAGFTQVMDSMGRTVAFATDAETKIGREDIKTFVLRKGVPWSR